MLSKLKKNNNEGFTIIEVMIVLAIAGLILLIVFLAVPALQRNARNTARRTDAGRISSATNSFVTNNNGTLPGLTATALTDAQTILKEAGTLGQYNLTAAAGTGASNFDIVSGAQAALGANADAVQLVEAAQCSGAATIVGSSRQMALQYTLEGGSGSIGACLNI